MSRLGIDRSRGAEMRQGSWIGCLVAKMQSAPLTQPRHRGREAAQFHNKG